ncbi:MAG: NusG domain II-containing protein [Mariprofundus sp.]
MFDILKGTWTDRLLLLVSLLAIVAVWMAIRANISSGPPMADIYHADILVATYPLPHRGEAAIHLQVEGELGLSDIVIDEQGARIVSSPCASQRCVLSGSHRHAGDMVACVPNRILIALRGHDVSAFDAVVE